MELFSIHGNETDRQTNSSSLFIDKNLLNPVYCETRKSTLYSHDYHLFFLQSFWYSFQCVVVTFFSFLFNDHDNCIFFTFFFFSFEFFYWYWTQTVGNFFGERGNSFDLISFYLFVSFEMNLLPWSGRCCLATCLMQLPTYALDIFLWFWEIRTIFEGGKLCLKFSTFEGVNGLTMQLNRSCFTSWLSLVL